MLLLLPVGLQLGQIKETSLVFSVFMTVFSTAIARRPETNTDWKCDAGSVNRYSIASDDRRDRICRAGETYERAINNERLSLFDAASVETDAFSVAKPFFDLSSLIWRDDVS